jgi:ribokinase
MPKIPRIVVVGSINMDLVARVPQLPRPGETVLGTAFSQVPGGKGANQAVAAARLGADVTMIGRVGDDVFGEQLLVSLRRHGVRTEQVQRAANCPSGLALIGVDDSGQNSITVIGGANQRLTPKDIEAQSAAIAGADALLVQLEVPLETVVAAVAVARQHGVLTILDPAPPPSGALPAELYAVDVLSPNQAEAEALTGVAVTSVSTAIIAARKLHERGARQVVFKLGAQGALAGESGGEFAQIPAPQVRVVDTTAAGDAFTAALAVALIEGRSLGEATRFACAAGSLATTRAGAQDAMPSREEVVAELARVPEG